MQTLYTVQYEGNKFWLDVDHGDGLPYQDDLFECLDLFLKNTYFWIETKTKSQRKFRPSCVSAKSPLALLENVSCFLDNHEDVQIRSNDYVIIFYR